MGESTGSDAAERDNRRAIGTRTTHDQRTSEFEMDEVHYASKQAYVSLKQGRKRKPPMNRKERFWMAGGEFFKDIKAEGLTLDENEVGIGSWVIAWVFKPGSLVEGNLEVAWVSQIAYSPTVKSAFLRQKLQMRPNANHILVVQVARMEGIDNNREKYVLDTPRWIVKIKTGDIFAVAEVEEVSDEDGSYTKRVLLSERCSKVRRDNDALVRARALKENERVMKERRGSKRSKANDIQGTETSRADDVSRELERVLGDLSTMRVNREAVTEGLRKGSIVTIQMWRHDAENLASGVHLKRLGAKVTDTSPIGGGLEIVGFSHGTSGDRASVCGRLKAGDIIIKRMDNHVYRYGSLALKFDQGATLMTLEVYTQEEDARPELNVEWEKCMLTTHIDETRAKLHAGIREVDSNMVGRRFTDKADEGDDESKGAVYEIKEVHYDEEYHCVLAMAMDTTRSDRSPEFCSTSEVRHGWGMCLLPAGCDNEESTNQLISPYEQARNERVNRNNEFMRGLGFAV